MQGGPSSLPDFTAVKFEKREPDQRHRARLQGCSRPKYRNPREADGAA